MYFTKCLFEQFYRTPGIIYDRMSITGTRKIIDKSQSMCVVPTWSDSQIVSIQALNQSIYSVILKNINS
jgi:hypothetical protein